MISTISTRKTYDFKTYSRSNSLVYIKKKALETIKIHSVSGNIDKETSLMTSRPFRSPCHKISDVALVGGGNYPQPGEISLAHNGVLFLDELPEFKRTVLEVMRNHWRIGI